MISIWAKEYINTKNTTLGFTFALPYPMKFNLKITASSVFQVFVDGKLKGFGPNRTAKGFCRISDYVLTGKYVVVRVHNHFINSYAYQKQNPFFSAEIFTIEGQIYNSKDFRCYHLDERVQKVPRYSYQRGFSEVYQISNDPHRFLIDEEENTLLEVVEVNMPIVLPAKTSHPKLNRHHPDIIKEGLVKRKIHLNSKWRPNFTALVGQKLEGYTDQEWQEVPFDEVDEFEFVSSASPDAVGNYKILDFKRSITGFFDILIEVESCGSLYLLFDEIIDEKSSHYIDYRRYNTNNILKWTFKQAGQYRLVTMEPYSARYVNLISTIPAKWRLSLIDFENPDTDKFVFETDDEELNLIYQAAKNTFSQNAVDILMDCPSRERAGWLSDSYFTATAERYFTGTNKVEHAFLDNYNLITQSDLPKGMVPMVYPADDYDRVFIPNWALWYILELSKYHDFHPDSTLVKDATHTLREILNYFSKFENEFHLLENLESWVFVEWSAANDLERVCGVNIPTNALYAKALEQASFLLNDENLRHKANKIRQNIKKMAYNGEFFVDNLLRKEDDSLIRSKHLSEVCQYYVFWTDCCEIDEYKDLFNRLISKMGPYRTNESEHIAAPNMMYGIYMRLDLLLKSGQRDLLLKECKYYFLNMAQQTSTLWENNLPSASCNHGFASYSIRWLVFIVTGFDLLDSNRLSDINSLGLSGKIEIPHLGSETIKFTFDQAGVKRV